jgi:hypothetical protein
MNVTIVRQYEASTMGLQLDGEDMSSADREQT